MVKGKHKPAPGAVRPDKVLHPQSRKVKRLHGKEVRKQNLSSNASAGGQRLQALGKLECKIIKPKCEAHSDLSPGKKLISILK